MPRPFILVAAAAAILCVQGLVGSLVYFALPDWASRGQFGDVFGVANALFSGLAFAGLIYTILLQREELSLQRKELELTRAELSRTAAAQEQAEVALRAQADASMQSARLAATNYLLEHYKEGLRRLRGQAYTQNDPRLENLRELERREATLIEILDSLYQQITQAERRE